MRLGFDLDGVLCNFVDGFTKRIIKVTGVDRFPLEPYEITTWDYPLDFGYSKKDLHNTWESVKADEWFWEVLLPYPDTDVILDRLWALSIREHDIYFITHRMGRDAKGQAERWLKAKNALRLSCWREWVPTVLISSNKERCCEALQLDRYIDDKIENCIAVQNGTSPTRAYILTRPWNVDFDAEAIGCVRVNSVMEMLEGLN